MIQIDLDSSLSLEDQLCAELRAAIARGEVADGETLPPVRQLASDLCIHWNTVARAYRRLRDENLLSVRRGRGVIVKYRPHSASPTSADERDVRDRLKQAFVDARLAGLPLQKIQELFAGELKEWEAREL